MNGLCELTALRPLDREAPIRRSRHQQGHRDTRVQKNIRHASDPEFEDVGNARCKEFETSLSCSDIWGLRCNYLCVIVRLEPSGAPEDTLGIFVICRRLPSVVVQCVPSLAVRPRSQSGMFHIEQGGRPNRLFPPGLGSWVRFLSCSGPVSFQVFCVMFPLLSTTDRVSWRLTGQSRVQRNTKLKTWVSNQKLRSCHAGTRITSFYVSPGFQTYDPSNRWSFFFTPGTGPCGPRPHRSGPQSKTVSDRLHLM